MTSKREEKRMGITIIIMGLVLLIGATIIMKEDRAYIIIVLMSLGISVGGCFIHGFSKNKKMKSKLRNVFRKHRK